ncbi:hypothetical protein CHS0354_038219 [Potamilus streckersoni]|uniref:Gamma-soluble NSF attachment protein n=1 Tax=Potamilus streckersoni TaxID=2493646 RepID=A0AAE0T0U9_9BIVA|nr:hypothetical protein CHS0354_038219 [Potamilus streckersoni]
MTSKKRLGEAFGHIAQAEKCMKTSFFKWNPDLDGAISEYIKAATVFRNVKALSEARDAYVKAAELQQRMNDPFHAAKSYEQAGFLSKENNEIEKAVNFMEHATQMFQEHGTPDTAALCMDKAAKMVETTHPSKAAELYQRACEIAELEDKSRQCAEFIGKAGRLLIRLQRYDEAISSLKKEIDFLKAAENYDQIKKVVIGLILLLLHNGDYVAAEQFFNSAISYTSFPESEEAAAMETLLSAYDEGDEDEARRILALPLIKYMDNVFAKLARDLVIPGGVKKNKAQQKGTTDAGNGALGGVLDDEELEGGLC